MSSWRAAWWRMPLATGPAAVTLGGEFDLLTTPALRAAYGSDRSRAGEPICFDLRAVSFADSSLAHLLLDVHQAGEHSGAPLTVRVRQDSEVRRMLQVTGVDRRVPVLDERGAPVGTLLVGPRGS